MYKKLLIIAVSVGLNACAGIGTQFAKMSEPESGERARVRVHANMLVKGVPNSQCVDWDKNGAGTILGGMVGSSGYRGRSLNIPNPDGISNSATAEFYVAANQPFSIALVNTPESRFTCSVSGTFVPEKNKDYQIGLSTAANGYSQSVCKMLIEEVHSTGKSPVEFSKAASCK